MKLLLQQAHYLNPNQAKQQGDIAIAKGKIQAVGTVRDFSPDQTIAATDYLVIPAMVDLATRLREPGQTKKGSIYSETQAAAAAGFGFVCLPPDTKPVIDSQAVVELVEQRQQQAGFSKVLPIGALTEGLQGEVLANMGSLVNEGCVGVGHALRPFQSLGVLRKALEYATSLGLTVHVHPHSHSLAQEGLVHASAIGTRLGLPGVPYSAETVALAEILLLAEETGAKVHVCRLSSAKAVEMLRQAKADGLAVSTDVSLSQLFYTDQDVLGYDSNFHVLPPFRSKEDLAALRAGVLDGTIDAICSDHQPHDHDAKLRPFSETAPGVSALDSFVPQLLALAEVLSCGLETILPLVTNQPAAIAGQTPWQIQPGDPAHLTMIDPEKTWPLDAATMLSQGLNTPLFGQQVRGQVQACMLGGTIIFDRR